MNYTDKDVAEYNWLRAIIDSLNRIIRPTREQIIELHTARKDISDNPYSVYLYYKRTKELTTPIHTPPPE